MKIAITGSTGFIGSHLCSYFPDVIPLTRKDFETGLLAEKISQSDMVINLAGSPIIKRWTKAYRKELVESRLQTTRQVVKAVNESGVTHLVSASAIGIYPDDKPCDESCRERGTDFLADLTAKWEEEAGQCSKRLTIVRFGVVLGKGGGALSKMLVPFRLGLGGPIGTGDMIMSWIALEDVARLMEFIIDSGLTGVFNAVSPNPVSNREFSKSLAGVLHRPAIFPVPEFVLKLIFGQAATVLTASKEVYPRRAMEAGFRFRLPEIRPALEYILGTRT